MPPIQPIAPLRTAGVQVWTIALALLAPWLLRAEDVSPKEDKARLAETITDGIWLRPNQNLPAEPVWGFKDGLAVGLWPTSGPRGLLRVYAPYLGQGRRRMINFISIEPIVKGQRGQSELEISQEDKRPGLHFWTADSREETRLPRDPTLPAHGKIGRWGETEALTFFLATEPYRNGARPILQVILRADRPHEVGFRIHAAKESAPMSACILSATMGNYGRLRHLWLRGEVADSRKVWPKFVPDKLGFTPWHEWHRDRLLVLDKSVLVAATSNESDLTHADYDSKVPPHWRYEGKAATQYWHTADVKETQVAVNGRSTYWGANAQIPGGVAYENFELRAPFKDGQEFWFGMTLDAPTKLGFDPKWQKNVTDGK